MPPRERRSRDLLAALLLLLLPAALLGDSLFTDREFLPFDLAEFPPVATTLSREQVAVLREGANYDATEAPVWFVPEWTLARDALANGRYPHWNPFVRGGAPLTAHGHLGLLNPLHWPAFLFADPVDGLLYLTYAMFALAGVLMFGLLRELRLSTTAALFGAVAFAWSGTLTANGHWYMRMEPLALLPGMLWALLRIDRAAGIERALPATLLAVAVALCWTAGFPPFAIPVTLLAGLFGVVLAVRAALRGGVRAASTMAWLAIGMALGLLLAGVQVLQQAWFFPFSNRPPAPTLAQASEHAFDPMGFLGYLLPEAFSHPTDRLLPGARSPLAFLLYSRTEWGTGRPLSPEDGYNFTEYAVFPGTLPLVFALLGALLAGPRWRWLCVGALAFLFALAIGPGPAKLAFALPGVSAVPPYRFVGPACAFVAILAALGCERLLQGTRPWILRAACVVGVAAAAFCLGTASDLANDTEMVEQRWLQQITDNVRPLWPRPDEVRPETVEAHLFTARGADGVAVDRLRLGRERLENELRRAGFALLLGSGLLLLLSLRAGPRPFAPWIVWPALAFTGAELFVFGHALNRGRETPVPIDTEVHAFLQAQRDARATTGGVMVARANPHGGDPWHLPPGSLARLGIRDLHFYTFVDAHSSEPIRALYGDDFMLRHYVPAALPDDERLQLPWWDLVGLRYLLTTAPMRHAGRRVGPELRGEGGEFFVYERESALPRAWIVPALREVADDRAAYAAVLDPSLRPREVAIVTTTENAKLPAIPRDPAAADRTVRVGHEDEKRLVLHVSDGPAGWLVVADTWMPGWTATIGDAEVPIARVNAYQRAVPLPAGEATVSFRYRTPGLLAGIAVSCTAALIALALCVAALRARRRRHREAMANTAGPE